MGERNLTQTISDQDISRIIHYLDPDCQKANCRNSQNPGLEPVLTLILLLGGVIAALVVIVCRVND